jgi:hypothetical protein
MRKSAKGFSQNVLDRETGPMVCMPQRGSCALCWNAGCLRDFLAGQLALTPYPRSYILWSPAVSAPRGGLKRESSAPHGEANPELSRSGNWERTARVSTGAMRSWEAASSRSKREILAPRP